jgi:histidinol-phosphatase (PHP family)
MTKNPRFSSLHNHSIFCDGKDDIETLCRSAFEKNLYAIGFSAHAPITKKTGIESDWHLKDDRFNEYVEQVLAAKKRWHGKLEVLLGFEIDYIKGLRSALDKDITEVNPDYLIGSVHFLIPANGAKPFTVDGPQEEFTQGLNEGFNGDAQALMNSYYDAQLEMIALGGFEILGHADLVKKNCIGKNLWPREEEVYRQKEIALASGKASGKAAGKAGIIAEVNTGGINRNKINEVYPSGTFLSFFRENNVPVIITADAHSAPEIKGNYDIAVKTLLSAGFSDHVIIFRKNGKNIKCIKEKLLNFLADK